VSSTLRRGAAVLAARNRGSGRGGLSRLLGHRARSSGVAKAAGRGLGKKKFLKRAGAVAVAGLAGERLQVFLPNQLKF